MDHFWNFWLFFRKMLYLWFYVWNVCSAMTGIFEVYLSQEVWTRKKHLTENRRVGSHTWSKNLEVPKMGMIAKYTRPKEVSFSRNMCWVFLLVVRSLFWTIISILMIFILVGVTYSRALLLQGNSRWFYRPLWEIYEVYHQPDTCWDEIQNEIWLWWFSRKTVQYNSN